MSHLRKRMLRLIQRFLRWARAVWRRFRKKELDTEVTSQDFQNYLNHLLQVVPEDGWQERAAALRKKGTDLGDPTTVADSYELEFAMARFLQDRRSQGSTPRSSDAVLTFVTAFSQVYDLVSPEGKKKLAGSLRHGLKSDDGLRPLAFELRTVANLATRGFEVEFHDLESGGFDFVATKKLSAHIECKSLGPDLGRQVPRREFRKLATRLEADLQSALSSAPNSHIAITIPKRLERADPQHRDIASCVRAALASSDRSSTSAECSVEVAAVDPRNPVIAQIIRSRTLPDHQVACEALGIAPNSHVTFHVSEAVIALSLRSETEDEVVEQMLTRLKDEVKRQLKGDRPSAICVELADVSDAQLVELGADLHSPFQWELLNELFADRPQLGAVVIVAGKSNAGPRTYVCKRVGIDNATSQLFSEMFA